MQVRQARELGQFIHPARPLCTFIHFLQGHEVWVDAGHHAGETRQIDTAVHAFAMMNVVGQHAERERDRLETRTPDHQQQQERGREPGS